jgi:luciferase family oxidoreductase group 1
VLPRIGILDQSPVLAFATPERAIAETIALVKRAEALGYERYWFAEHHGRAHAFASASPELMIARAAAETSRIRLGSGGVLLSHYSPLKVAENFRLLEAFAPGRVDLGIGRGTGSDEETGRALDGDAPAAQPYADRVADLLTFLNAGFPAGHAFADTAVTPVIGRAPEPWILGSTGSGARIAAENGVPFAFAHFIKGDGAAIAAGYRAAYRPSPVFPAPRVLITIAAYCSDDAQERDDFLATLRLRRARMRLEQDPWPPSRDEARTHVPSAAERAEFEDTMRVAIVAGPETIAERIASVAHAHGAGDVLILSVTPDYPSRLRSYELIAAAWAAAAIS